MMGPGGTDDNGPAFSTPGNVRVSDIASRTGRLVP